MESISLAGFLGRDKVNAVVRRQQAGNAATAVESDAIHPSPDRAKRINLEYKITGNFR
jgi:hypothetical protein